jgi:hypothetical protein
MLDRRSGQDEVCLIELRSLTVDSHENYRDRIDTGMQKQSVAVVNLVRPFAQSNCSNPRHPRAAFFELQQ